MLDRRQFLSLFSATTLATIAKSASLALLHDDHFDSPAFGLSLDIPSGWVRWTAADFLNNPERLDFIDGAEEEHERATALVAFSRWREPHPDPNAGLCVYADRYESWMGDDIRVFAQSAVHYFSSALSACKITRRAENVRIANSDAAHATLVYQSIDSDGRGRPAEDEYFMMFHAGFLLVLQFVQPPIGPFRAVDSFQTIQRSVRLRKPQAK